MPARRAAAAALLFFVAGSGCGESSGKLKGRVVENGTPVPVPFQAALMFTAVDANDKPIQMKSYTVNLDPEGTFELFASDGSLPTGKYMVSIESPMPAGSTGLLKYKTALKYPGSKLRVELVRGMNDLTVDLAKTPN